MPAFTRRPAPGLGPFISSYAGFEVDGAPDSDQAALPSRHINLVISLSGPISISGPDGSTSFTSLVGGLHLGPLQLEGPPRPSGLRVMVSPLGARALLGVSSADLVGRTVELSEVLGPDAVEILQRTQRAAAWGHRFDILDEILGRRLRDARHTHPAIRGAWAHIFGKSGGYSISAAADAGGCSRRRLAELFRDEIGLSPKSLARIARFEHACRLIRDEGGSLAGLAQGAGFADQSHLNREWVAMAGRPPAAWIRRDRPFLQDYELGGGVTMGK